MRARWVKRHPSPDLPIVAQAWVASLWPWRFYFVSTIQLQEDSSNPLGKLTRRVRSLKTGVSYNEVPPEPDKFFTHIYRCDKYLLVKSLDDPLFEREYSNLSEAQIGHNEAVDLLSKGKLKLSHVRKA